MTFLNQYANAVVSYSEPAFQTVSAAVVKLKDYRNNPEIFQKIFQIIVESIQLYNWHHQVVAFPKLVKTLSTANLHDFYQIIKEPREFLCPIKADVINAPQLLENVVAKLAAAYPIHDQQALRALAKNQIDLQLKIMAANDDAYHSTQDFALVLERGLKKAFQPYMGADANRIDLSDLDVPTFAPTLVDRIVNLTWTFVNFGCVGLYASGWNLLDTGMWAHRIGQHKGFNWIKNQSLETWVRGAVCLAFSAKLFEATRKLSDERLSPNARTNAKLDAISALFEVVYQGAGYINHRAILNISPGFIHSAAIFAKGVGLVCICLRPKPNYFEVAAV
jgi:hypothetical protein